MIDEPWRATLRALAVTIDRPPEELHHFWRDFSNLAVIMDNIEPIDVVDRTRSRCRLPRAGLAAGNSTGDWAG